MRKDSLKVIRPSQRFGRILAALLLSAGLLLTACGDETNSRTLPTEAAGLTTAAGSPVSSPAQTTAGTSTTASTGAITAATAATTTATTAATGATTTDPGTKPGGTPNPISAVPTVKVPEAATQEMNKIASQTEKTRKLNFKQPVERNFMTRADLAKYQEEEFRRDNPPEDITKYQKIYEIFGFTPKGFDLARTYIDLLNEQVLGFYDPQTKKLYIVVDGDPNKVSPLVKFTVEHELTHGLQDQYYDLQKLRPIRKPTDTEWNDDRDAALTALIEGDAVQSQTVWLLGGNLSQSELQQIVTESGSSSSNQLDKSPLILKDTLLFPYEAGASFVQQVYQKGGWAAVDKVWKESPPQSTSQILHPEKYLNRVEPVKVALTSQVETLGNGWKSLDINTQGELQTRIWLQGGVGADEAKKAATGWAGDRYQVVEDAQGQAGFVWRSQWDNDKESGEFYQSALSAAKKIYSLNGDGTGSDVKRTWTTATQDISLIRKGNEVLITVMPKGGNADKVVGKIGF